MLKRKMIVVCLVLAQAVSAQWYPPNTYPQGYFRNPLGIPVTLSGNFGELRPNHYHMGLDMKTQARENLPVYAAADGYISRIKVEPAGFGQAIYINHPNGFTTLYAHLNAFNPALERWVKYQQYQQQSWRVFLELPPDLFPVKKGDFIAYSGNTGGSQAPHLHFEIRRTADDVNLNPFLFGFPLSDNQAPQLLRLGIYDRRRSVYEQSPRLVPVKKSAAGRYATTPSIINVASPIISLGISGYDTHNGSASHIGIFEALLYENGQLINGFQMDRISYNDTRYLNAHIDYRLKTTGGGYLQHLSDLPGYINSIYKNVQGNGVLDISDGQVHDIKIEVKDAAGNMVTLTTRLQYNGALSIPVQPEGKLFYPLMLDGFESGECEFFVGERCLYDSVHIKYSRMAAASTQAVSSLHSIGARYIPLQDSILIRMRANRSLTDAEKARTVMQWLGSGKTDVQKVDWQNEWASARFREFGKYQLLVDTTPPVIVPVGFTSGANLGKASRLVFTIRDNLGRFKNVRTELDGQWLRFSNDKGLTFIYRFDEKCLPGPHELKITAADEAGNVTESVYKFSR